MVLVAPQTSTTPQPTTNPLQSFAQGVLSQGHYPNTPQNQAFIEGWASHENTSAAFNPLATTLRTSSSSALQGNTAGVQEYGSQSEGIAATVATLQNGDYPSINSALASGNPWPANASGALGNNLATWSGGGYTSVNPAPGGYTAPSLGGSGSSGGSGASSTTSSTGSASGAVNGQCDPSKCATGTLLGFCPLKECTAKHLVGGLAAIGGGLVVLVGVALLFAGGHGVAGKAAEVAGAGVALVPGGEAVGAAAATAGHRMSAQSKNKSQASKAQKALRAPPAPSRKAQQAEQEQQLQDAHAQGVATGRSQGRQKNGLKMGYNRGSGSRYEEAA